ncbi:phosphotransferase [Nocardia sp. NBC_00881]|uniref:phosphotransferase n=1 Tax=Nocardia sp. NBC_00881 TaxID=2975995 RepID=UPI00386CDBE4|nr:phosphotransferase [Nocardia sp. NBC_00881]
MPVADIADVVVHGGDGEALSQNLPADRPKVRGTVPAGEGGGKYERPDVPWPHEQNLCGPLTMQDIGAVTGRDDLGGFTAGSSGMLVSRIEGVMGGRKQVFTDIGEAVARLREWGARRDAENPGSGRDVGMLVFDPTYTREGGEQGDLGHTYWLVRRVEADGAVWIELRDKGKGVFRPNFVPAPESAGRAVFGMFLDPNGGRVEVADAYGVVRTSDRDFSVGVSGKDRSAGRGPDDVDPARSDPTAEDGFLDLPIEEQIHRNGRGRFEISPEEAQELYELVGNREPDFAGTGNRVHLVDTNSGPAVVRTSKKQPTVVFLKKWMPENAAIEYARECDVRTPKILYAGADPTTGGEFTIMQYISGETRGFDDPELMNWLPDLLDQVTSMSSHPVPAGMELDVPGWQQQMIQYADDAYHNLPQNHLSKLDELGIGPLSEYVQPDHSRSGEPVVFAHNDLYPPNLQLDDQGKLWIFDWEYAGPGDPLYNAAFFLERVIWQDEATRARATAMWIERMSLNPAVDTEVALRMYGSFEDWRGTVMNAETMLHSFAENPSLFEEWVDWYHTRLSRHSEPWPDISRDELRALFRRWAELA